MRITRTARECRSRNSEMPLLVAVITIRRPLDAISHLSVVSGIGDPVTLMTPKKPENSSAVQPFDDCPPPLDRISPYDERHLVSYLRLLDAEAEGADWHEAVAVIFGIDPLQEPERAKRVYDNHLARARWITEQGYRHLLEPRLQ
jgi:Uncharacterized conserved protein (DUF2285)